MDKFQEVTQEELMAIDGGGLFEDLGYAVGYGLRGAYEGAKQLGNFAKEAVNPRNYVDHFYPGLWPR